MIILRALLRLKYTQMKNLTLMQQFLSYQFCGGLREA